MCPLDELGAQSNSKTNEPSSDANANAVSDPAGNVEIVQTDYVPTHDDVL